MVGVLLGRDPEPLGEWLADAAAFDAAGADALCVDCGPEPEWDVLALAAALAVVTYQTRLMVAVPGEAPARTVDTVARLSRGRVVLGRGEREGEGWAGWERVRVPDGRAAWGATCADAAERGVTGLVVPASPRLLDMLRNPEDPGERHDLQLAQG